jgi:hypothetical protein
MGMSDVVDRDSVGEGIAVELLPDDSGDPVLQVVEDSLEAGSEDLGLMN